MLNYIFACNIFYTGSKVYLHESDRSSWKKISIWGMLISLKYFLKLKEKLLNVYNVIIVSKNHLLKEQKQLQVTYDIKIETDDQPLNCSCKKSQDLDVFSIEPFEFVVKLLNMKVS